MAFMSSSIDKKRYTKVTSSEQNLKLEYVIGTPVTS